MAAYTDLYAHCVWATWDRLPIIPQDAELRLYNAIGAKCIELGCCALAIGGISDHVHVLLRFTPTIALSQLIGEIKGASSHVMTHEIRPGAFFKWQAGYGMFTLSKRGLPHVARYIEQQRIHHANASTIDALELPASPLPRSLR